MEHSDKPSVEDVHHKAAIEAEEFYRRLDGYSLGNEDKLFDVIYDVLLGIWDGATSKKFIVLIENN